MLDTCNPYTASAMVFQPLKTARSLPESDLSDIYAYLVENPSPSTAARVKAYKSTDSYMYFSIWICE